MKPLSEPIPAGRSAAFERDRVVRLVAGDGYHVHRLIYEALAKDGVRDFLFAPFAATGGLHVVLVRSRDAKTSFAEGQRFRMTLRAMPSVKSDGRRRSIGAGRSKDSLRLRWIRARGRENGFDLLAEPEMQVERVRLEEAKPPSPSMPASTGRRSGSRTPGSSPMRMSEGSDRAGHGAAV